MIQSALTIAESEARVALRKRKTRQSLDFSMLEHSYEIAGARHDLSLQHVALGILDNVVTIQIPASLATQPDSIRARHEMYVDDAIEYRLTLPGDADVSKLIIALDDDFFRIIIGRFSPTSALARPNTTSECPK